MSSAKEKYEDEMLALLSGELDESQEQVLRAAIADHPDLVKKLDAWQTIDRVSRQPMAAPDPLVSAALKKAARKAVQPQHRVGFSALMEFLSATPSFASLGLVVITGSLVFVLLGEFDELEYDTVNQLGSSKAASPVKSERAEEDSLGERDRFVVPTDPERQHEGQGDLVPELPSEGPASQLATRPQGRVDASTVRRQPRVNQKTSHSKARPKATTPKPEKTRVQTRKRLSQPKSVAPVDMGVDAPGPETMGGVKPTSKQSDGSFDDAVDPGRVPSTAMQLPRVERPILAKRKADEPAANGNDESELNAVALPKPVELLVPSPNAENRLRKASRGRPQKRPENLVLFEATPSEAEKDEDAHQKGRTFVAQKRGKLIETHQGPRSALEAAGLEMRRGNIVAAERILEMLLESNLSSQLRQEALLALGQCHEARGETSVALNLYRRAASIIGPFSQRALDAARRLSEQ